MEVDKNLAGSFPDLHDGDDRHDSIDRAFTNQGGGGGGGGHH